MTTYKGKSAVIARPVGELYGRFSNMSALEDALKNGQNSDLRPGDIKFDEDSLTIVNQQVGEIKFKIVERVEPEKIVFSAENSPLPIGMTIHLKSIDDMSTEVSTSIDIEIPVVMKALIGSKLQQVADKFGSMMAQMGK